jgi:hypothetical protein
MQRLRKNDWWRRTAWGLIAAGLFLMATPALAVDEAMLERMEALIQQQQRQIEAQAKAIEKLQQQVGTMKEEAVKEATEAARTEFATAVADPARSPARGKDMVTHANDKLSLQIYGQVNRGGLFADDGDSSDYYFVDNDNSSSRFGFLGESQVNEDITVGTRMEFEYQSNPSNTVNQDDKDPDGDSFDDRWVDGQITSKRFGKLYIGKGEHGLQQHLRDRPLRHGRGGLFLHRGHVRRHPVLRQ